MAGRSPRINTQIADYFADRKIFGERSLQILHGFFYLLSRLELLNCSFLIYFELGKIVETSKKTLFRSLRTYSNGNIKHENLKLVTISSPPFRLHLRSFPPRIPTLIWLASPPSKATREHVAIIKQIHHPLRREILPASSNIFEPQFIASRLFRTGSWVGTHVYTPSCTHTRNRGWWARARMTHPPVWPVGFRLIRWLTGCTRPDLTGLHRCNTHSQMYIRYNLPSFRVAPECFSFIKRRFNCESIPRWGADDVWPASSNMCAKVYTWGYFSKGRPATWLIFEGTVK